MSDRIVKTRLFDSAVLSGLSVLTSPIIDVRTARALIGVRAMPVVLSSGSPDFKIDVAWGDYMTLPPMPTSYLLTPQPNMDSFETNILTSWNTTYGTTGPQDWHTIAFANVLPQDGFIQVRFTGIAANPTGAGVALTAKLVMQEAM